MDNLDIDIIKMLSVDGRMSYKTIASKLNVTEPTVRARANNLINENKIQIKAYLNPNEIPDMIVAYVGIHQTGDPLKCMDHFMEIPEVVYAANTMGRFDVIVVVAVNNRERLAEILTKEIHGEHPDYDGFNITTSETHVVLYNRNLLIPGENVAEIMNSD